MRNRIELPTLVTERLTLREIEDRDAEDFYAFARDPRVGPSAGWAPHSSLSETRTSIKLFRARHHDRNLGVYAMIERGSGRMIGTIELYDYIAGHSAELGYSLSPDWWGQGMTEEAATALLDWGFAALRLRRVECTIYPANLRSIRVCEKLGFAREGLRQNGYLTLDGEVHDVLVYAMTDEIWKMHPTRKEGGCS